MKIQVKTRTGKTRTLRMFDNVHAASVNKMGMVYAFNAETATIKTAVGLIEVPVSDITFISAN
jgi:hypothetical protein